MKYSFLGIAATLFFISCGNGDAANTTKNDTATVPVAANEPYTPPAGVDAAVSNSLNPVTAGYLQLKNALAADNGKEAAQAGQAILNALSAVDTSGMTADQKSGFRDIADDMHEQAEHIADNADKIDHQRMHFKMLSDDMTEIAKIFGGGRKLYVAHCPMAFDGKGASWISEFAEIKNPYYGDEMLECGEVKEELK